MMIDRDDLAHDLAIEPHALDVAAIRQADAFFKWAEKYAEAKAKLDEIQRETDATEAKLYLRAEENPTQFGITKTTVKAMEAAVATQPKMMELEELLLRAKSVVYHLNEARNAMEQKKSMIEVLVKLHGQQYFAGPSVPRDLVSAWQEYQSGLGTTANEKGAAAARKRVKKTEGV